MEIKVTIPRGFRLIGTRTEKRSVVVVFAPEQAETPKPERRPIGFQYQQEPRENLKE